MEGGNEAAHSAHRHTGVSGNHLTSSMPGLRGHGWLRQGRHTHWPERPVEELAGFVLLAKASHGKFQKEGGIGLELQDM